LVFNKPNGSLLGTCSATSDKPGGNCNSDTDCANGCSSYGLCIKDQINSDGDGLGDVCDTCPLDAYNDIDGDGVCGNADNCPNNSDPDQIDSDGNGIGNRCDTEYLWTALQECEAQLPK
jgi:hypothetical protein